MDIVSKLRDFLEQEARSCSMEYYWFMINGSGLILVHD